MRNFRVEVFYISCYEEGYKLFIDDKFINMDFGWCKYWAEVCFDNGQDAGYGLEKWLGYELDNISKLLPTPLNPEERKQVGNLLSDKAYKTINWWIQNWRNDEYNRVNGIVC